MRSLTALLMLIAAFALAACGDDDDDGGSAATETAPTETQAGAPEPAEGECRQVDAPAPGEDGGAEEPDGKLAKDATPVATVKTNCGEFTIEIDAKTSPNLAASFVKLAEDGFYENTVFHRIVPGFVIQGGDPTGTGTGGPGYQTVDEPPSDTRYTKGVVAMAKTGTEAPGTSGSQFFVVTGEDVGLPPEFAVLGKVTDGIDVVERIGSLGDPATEQPTQTVVIESIEVSGT